MFFIFRHSERSGYKDVMGRIYHFTDKSPNYKKVKKNSKVLIYKKENNSIIGVAEIGEVKKEKKGKITHFYAIYRKFKKFKNPIFCDEEFLSRIGINLMLDGKLPGIIPISKEIFDRVLFKL